MGWHKEVQERKATIADDRAMVQQEARTRCQGGNRACEQRQEGEKTAVGGVEAAQKPKHRHDDHEKKPTIHPPLFPQCSGPKQER